VIKRKEKLYNLLSLNIYRVGFVEKEKKTKQYIISGVVQLST
jgi:hypothetical protein